MRVAVTGADGFVGRHLCACLAAQGAIVKAIVGPPSPEGIDILDAPALRRALAEFGPEGVVHLAGVSSVARSHEAPLEAFRVNALGAVTLCETLRDVAPRARLVLIGSGEVYGPIPPGERASEGARLVPTSPYAAAKAAAELAALQFHRAYGLPVVAARPFNHLGRGQAGHFAVPSFARQLTAMGDGAARENVLSVGNLEPIRDFSHVLDVVDAYAILLERGVPGEAYNVCSGVGRSMRALIEEMITASGSRVRIEVEPARVRPVEIPNLVGDPSKLEALGWRRTHTVHEALEDALGEARAAR